MISLKQLHYALAIEKTLHFKKAAQECNISQSTLSTAISELENQLRVTIFERNNKQVLITNNGQLILDKAKKIKFEVNELLQLSQSNETPFSCPMSIGVIPTIGPYLLPKVLPKLKQTYPDFKIKIVEAQSNDLVNMLKNGEIDAAILALPYPIDGLMSFDFWKEDFYWVCHRDEYGNEKKEISSDELDIDKLILLKDGHCLTEHVLNACGIKDNTHSAEFDSVSLNTLVQMVAGKLGTTLVPQMSLDQLICHQSELISIHLNEPGPHRKISLLIRPNYTRTEEIVTMKEMFGEELAKTVIDTDSGCE